MGVINLLKEWSVKRPPGPSFSELFKVSEQKESYAVLDYPASLSTRFGELIYFSAAKQYLVTGALGFEHILKTAAQNYHKQNPFYTRMKPLFGKSLLLTEGDYWKHRRKIAQPAFQAGMIKNYVPIITEECQRYCEAQKSKPPSKINVLSSMNHLILKIALRLFCSKDFPESSLKQLGKTIHFGNWYVSHTFIIKPWKPGFRSLQFHFYMKQMNRFLLEIIRERRKLQDSKAAPLPQDLLTLLMSAENETGKDTLTDHEILDELKTLLLTGHETTACGLTWMWHLLSENPEYRVLLENELAEVLGERTPRFEDLAQLPVLKAIVSETFRLYPPIWCLARRSIDWDVICDYHTPPKSLFILNIYALHRNPDYWENPNAFYPPRFFEDAPKRHPSAYLPFSIGPRTCIASHFGMVETLLTAAILAQQLRFEKSSNTKVIPEPCISLRPKGVLWMKIKSR